MGGHGTGSTIITVPGGGHSILALVLEGTEVAEWAKLIGLNAIVLKYRVPVYFESAFLLQSG